MTFNPNQPPESNAATDFRDECYDDDEVVLAGRFARFAAATVDGLLVGAVTVGIYFATGFINQLLEDDSELRNTLIAMATPLLVGLALNGPTLLSRGQSIGKILAGIQIVDHQSSRLISFWMVYVIRNVWTVPLTAIVLMIPDESGDIVVNVLSLIDALLIFGVSRRCLHDSLAGTRVVKVQPGRRRHGQHNDPFADDQEYAQ